MFVKAEKKQAKLRLAIFAPSGGGKTYSSLRIAKGIVEKTGGRIAFIDTERRSASKYSDRFDFDVAELEDASIDNFVKAIDFASNNNYSVLILDSITHAWADLLQEIDKLALAKYRGNTWSAWSQGTPKQKKFIDSILNCNCHIIATMRVKTEWTTEKTDNGRSKPVRVGLSPDQGKGIEYEFDMLMEMNTEHFATVIKDRTGKYQDVSIEKPDESLGNELIDWLNDGVNVDDTIDEAIAGLIDCNTASDLKKIHLEFKSISTEKRWLTALSLRKAEILKTANNG